MKVREGGRVVLVHVLVATRVNGDRHREVLGVDVTSAEDGAGWLAFFRDLVARGLSGVSLVTSDGHTGLVAALGATRPAIRTSPRPTLPHPLRSQPDGRHTEGVLESPTAQCL
jgi:transposase-like protein